MNNDDSEALRDAIQQANPPQFPSLEDVNTALQARAKANVAHTPRQQGPWIVCTSCPNAHTLTWIGTTKSLVGIGEKGEFILKDRKF